MTAYMPPCASYKASCKSESPKWAFAIYNVADPQKLLGCKCANNTNAVSEINMQSLAFELVSSRLTEIYGSSFGFGYL